MIEITSKDQFISEISHGLVLVDFYATWCGPCQMLAPIMEDLSNEFSENGFRILKVNVDDNSDLAAEYAIMSIPTVMFFRDGEKLETMLGFAPKEVYQQKIQTFLDV